MEDEITFLEFLEILVVEIGDAMDRSLFFKPVSVTFDVFVIAAMALIHRIYV